MSNTKPNEAGAFLSGVGRLCAVPDIIITLNQIEVIVF